MDIQQERRRDLEAEAYLEVSREIHKSIAESFAFCKMAAKADEKADLLILWNVVLTAALIVLALVK